MMIILASSVIFSACSKIPDKKNQLGQGETNISSENQSKTEEQEEQKKQEGLTTKNETNLSPVPDIKNEKRQIVLYFTDKDLMNTYRVKKEINVSSKDQVAKDALEAWIRGPEHKELTGLVSSDVIVEYVEEVDGIAHVSFSKKIQESNMGSTGELMFAEQVAMIMQQFGFDRTQILVEGRLGETLFGHLYTGEPIVAKDPESYLWIDEKKSDKIVLQNTAFRIFEPAPNSDVKDHIIVRGLARVWEGTILYEFEDGHFILDEGFTTASEGAPGWGEFEIVIDLDDAVDYSGRVILYEESAKDGSRINELKIPVNVKG